MQLELFLLLYQQREVVIFLKMLNVILEWNNLECVSEQTIYKWKNSLLIEPSPQPKKCRLKKNTEE